MSELAVVVGVVNLAGLAGLGWGVWVVYTRLTVHLNALASIRAADAPPVSVAPVVRPHLDTITLHLLDEAGRLRTEVAVHQEPPAVYVYGGHSYLSVGTDGDIRYYREMV